MRRVNVNVLNHADNSSGNGNLIDSNQLISASFHAYFGDASANGTVKIQASNDPSPEGYSALQDFTPTNWVDIPNATATITSGGAAIITIAQTAYRWMRVVWTRSSGGSTTINVNMEALSI